MKRFMLFRSTWLVAGACIATIVMFFIMPAVISIIGLRTYETITTGAGSVTSLFFIVMAAFVGAVLASSLRHQNDHGPQQH